MSEDRREAAEAVVRDAVLASVALVARNRQDLDVPAQVLLEGTEVSLVCQVLAAICGAVFDATLPDGGRQLLVRISRNAVFDDGEAGR